MKSISEIQKEVEEIIKIYDAKMKGEHDSDTTVLHLLEEAVVEKLSYLKKKYS